MNQVDVIAPVDYVVVGHVTTDIVPDGFCLGGTVSYAGSAALAYGLRVGILTSWNESLPLGRLAEAQVVNQFVEKSTSFINQQTEVGRVQTVYNPAKLLDYSQFPDSWKDAAIVHLGPVVHEVDVELAGLFPNSLVGVTPQGWLRKWDEQGRVSPLEWDDFYRSDKYRALTQADVVVISVEDVDRSEVRIAQLAADCKMLAVTEAGDGSRLYYEGKVRRFPAVAVEEIDPVGAGDVYASALFYRLWQTKDPFEAARFASQVASYSVTRHGVDSAPTTTEIQICMNGRG